MKVLSKVSLQLESRVHLDWLNPAKYKVKTPPERPKSFFIQAHGEEDPIDGFRILSVNIETIREMNPGIFRQDAPDLLMDRLDGYTVSEPPLELEEAEGTWVYPWDLEELLVRDFSHLLHG